MTRLAIPRMIGPRFAADRKMRLAWAAVGLACAAILGVAFFLTPDPSGMGTHRQLGLPPCGFVLTSGLPCPTCGMTTAFCHVVRGRLLAGFVAQPAGFVLCLGMFGLMIYASYVAIFGRSIFVNWDRIGLRLMIALGGLFLAGWGFKLAHGFLTGTLPMK